MMKTLSIDASTRSTGIGIFEDAKLIHYECITATSSDILNRIEKMTKRIR